MVESLQPRDDMDEEVIRFFRWTLQAAVLRAEGTRRRDSALLVKRY